MHKPIFFNSVPTRPHFPAVSDCSDTWLCTVGFFTGLDCVSLGSTYSAFTWECDLWNAVSKGFWVVCAQLCCWMFTVHVVSEIDPQDIALLRVESSLFLIRRIRVFMTSTLHELCCRHRWVCSLWQQIIFSTYCLWKGSYFKRPKKSLV